MNTFQKYCEQRDQKLKEGLGSWAGGMADTAAGAIGKGLGKVGNAAMTGIGHGIMQGAKRGWGTYTQGQGSNQTHNWGMMAQKAAMSGDPDQFASAARFIYKQMKQAKQGAGGVMGGGPTDGSSVVDRMATPSQQTV